MQYLMVFIGGGLGSLCRFGIAKGIAPYQPMFPYATLMANILSCIVLGYLMQLSLNNTINQNLKWLLMVGFCGGFSTFSTFSSETFLLFQNGQTGYALLNIGGSIAVCLGAIYIGIVLGKS